MKLEYVAPKFLVKILEDPLFSKIFKSHLGGNEQFLHRIIEKDFAFLLENLMKIVLDYLYHTSKLYYTFES